MNIQADKNLKEKQVKKKKVKTKDKKHLKQFCHGFRKTT